MLRVADHFQKSDTGRQRRANEDSLIARAPLFAVADGMGGAQAGEVASRLAVEALAAGLGGGETAEERLAARVRDANRRIHDLSRADAQRAGMGTTLTAVHVGEDEVSIAHVGDSRAYLFRNSELTRLTRDHSLVEELMRQGKLTEEQADEHPQRSIITRALGPEPDVEVDTGTYPARAGDVFLLCSDGLTSMLGEGEVEAVLRASGSLADAGRRLIDAANEAGGRDNITVVLFRLEEVAGLAAGDDPGTLADAPPAEVDDSATRAHDVVPAARAGDAPDTAPIAPGSSAPGRAGVAPGLTRTARRGEGSRRRRRSRLRTAVRAGAVLAVVLAVLLIPAWFASRQVFFVGTNEQGIVTIYRGVPYSLPAGLDLYQPFYTSGVPADEVPAARRSKLLDHTLRSQRDASDLVRRLELGEIAGQ
jgi:protein phosphatase